MPDATQTLGRLKGRKHHKPNNDKNKWYGRRWKTAKQQHLKKEPLCRTCLNQGIVRTAAAVDHIIPHKGNMALFWNKSNWQSMCIQCHNTKSATE